MKSTVLIILLSVSVFCKPESNHRYSFNNEHDAEPEIIFNEQHFQAYSMNSISIWKSIVRSDLEKLDKNPGDSDLMLNTAFSYYGLLNSCVANRDEQTFNENVDKMQKLVSNLQDRKPEWSSVYVLQAAIYSSIMAFKPAKGMTLGSKNVKAIEKAIKIDTANPYAWMQKASSKFHTPKQFGGSITASINCYKKAIDLFETNKQLMENNWLYLYSLVWLGQAYTSNDQLDEAKVTYQKVLEIDSDYGWVKYNLLPEVEKKLASSE